jgi:hypothetical protein
LFKINQKGKKKSQVKRGALFIYVLEKKEIKKKDGDESLSQEPIKQSTNDSIVSIR